MAIKMFCDNCDRELRDTPDECNKDNSEWQPDARAKLTLEVQKEGMSKSWPINFDLCLRCAGRYLKVLRDPV